MILSYLKKALPYLSFSCPERSDDSMNLSKCQLAYFIDLCEANKLAQPAHGGKRKALGTLSTWENEIELKEMLGLFKNDFKLI